MNNSQFRKLVLDTPVCRPESASANPTSKDRVGASTSALGSRARSFIPMTPRSVSGSTYAKDFALQIAQRQNGPSHSNKIFRSSAAPKGTSLPVGYRDRTKSRIEGSEGQIDNDKGKRVNALEEMMKQNEIDETTFIKLRDEILGEEMNIERSNLVKGLDWRLLEKAKKGEIGAIDFLDNHHKEDIPHDNTKIDDELERLEQVRVEAIPHEKVKKKGEMAPPSLTGKKRTRDQILAELKAARKIVAEKELPPRLGSKFRKVGEPREETKIMRDGKGREFLITVDENGNEKRKVRKIPMEDQGVNKKNGLLIPNKDSKPLGMVVPEFPKTTNHDEVVNIFDDVGDDYNPLVGIENDDSSDEELVKTDQNEGSRNEIGKELEQENTGTIAGGTVSSSPGPSKSEPRNYFQTSQTAKLSPENNNNNKTLNLSDPTIMAALKKASKICLKVASSADGEDGIKDLVEEASTLRSKQERYKRMLQKDDRDAEDLDLGFGSSRVEDDFDGEERAIQLSKWGVDGCTKENIENRSNSKGKRKRGPKKRKGDVNSAADILSIVRQSSS
ncbi:putative inosine-uridine preferring nucleoside hydrolase [Golovinomyces cichoracearum]|uniref:Putative inosine-uridine preferring nucleoside hydrolase n=1 Tax=Golovinomyces cichoracearum TaxID=62708 RepID=A0A420J1A3_9PEZI|nr:putative inosine-uridine preferring nucleoside hydrolase [Golovinomyces cichoracearum]